MTQEKRALSLNISYSFVYENHLEIEQTLFLLKLQYLEIAMYSGLSYLCSPLGYVGGIDHNRYYFLF